MELPQRDEEAPEQGQMDPFLRPAAAADAGPRRGCGRRITAAASVALLAAAVGLAAWLGLGRGPAQAEAIVGGEITWLEDWGPGKQSDKFEKRDGDIVSGENILEKDMTIEEAKKMCSEMRNCKGFSYDNEDDSARKHMYFKPFSDNWEISEAVSKSWTSYQKIETRELALPSTGERLGTSLFCFMGVLPDSYEVDLLAAAKKKRASIFACEAYRFYHSSKTGTFEATGYGLDANFSANALVFTKIWDEVFDDGLYKEHDWTVKVDPDTVWIPDRLRRRLQTVDAGIHDAVYVRNCEWWLEIEGPLEVLSREGVAELSQADCPSSPNGGEDGWLHECTVALNMTGHTDLTVLTNLWPAPPIHECENGTAAAFHPFKNVTQWNECLDRLESQ